MKFNFIQYFFFLIISGGFCQNSISNLSRSDLEMGEKIKLSGKKLMEQKYGFVFISNDSSLNKEILIVGVHGWKSDGYEWIYGLKTFSNEYKYTYFYRYNWDVCPDSASGKLADDLMLLIGETPGIEKLIIFGHSYGGVVVTKLASKLHYNIPIEIHSIASPLRGYESLNTRCEIRKKQDGSINYYSWDKNILHFQWRTQHKLDGAFRKMKIDPQQIDLFDSRVTLLPNSMNGKRLGHNWSITWVVNEFLRIPHKL
tara:strand:+ start:11016 stop:11783 length:768 start_codon:yes stop_codon:yes gene_type:complete